MQSQVKNLLIVSVNPYFLEKEFVWYEKNLNQVLKATETQNFWQENVLFLEKNQNLKISDVLKKLDEMGYEKVFKTDEPGEFSQAGGMLEVFPVNTKNAFRLDFLGNTLETIEKLSLEIKDEKIAQELLKKKLKRQEMFSDIKGIKEGNYLVHLDHGIGRFLGTLKGAELLSVKELGSFYTLEYAKGDKLYVPVGLERKLSRYTGLVEPKLSRLGSILWQKTKRKIKEDTEKFAKELLNMFAQKETAIRPAYQKSELAERIATTFAYTLTPDQEQTLKEIEKDMLETEPMDRIVCGDVGFGKTEIALRIATRAAENLRQVVMIAPTTILANQHFFNFEKRLRGLPLKTALLTRLQSEKEKKDVLAKIKEGQIDILIGTHAVLSKKITFKNLGLFIIDDEQKFGVKQKEILRKNYPFLDVLYLSATPIPRTLHLALSSLKQLSFIKTAPEGRKPIKTFVLPLSSKTIKNALEKELRRGGQVYFLHNRIETISAVKEKLQRIMPQAKIAILHAKLPEKEIIQTLNDFQNKKQDILLSTTIIENGIDLGNVNTLIVDDAVKLGLSQAYQLRGRVGRAKKQAFAYFLYKSKTLKGKAEQRLKALKEAQNLGAGYQIAIRDLEIRGSGNILGKEQSGAVNRVGLNLYCQMLSEAVDKLRANK
ncbi:DEAD/DEAH box helicase [Candidatus Parcubacteria bacterium]|nr:DEAD/DEAH box helicase [Candidatus Parcubacteria bacterium]